MEKSIITDFLINASEIYSIQTTKILTNHTHGTGCTMASALSANLAKSWTVKQCFEIAHKYVNNAIKTSPKFGTRITRRVKLALSLGSGTTKRKSTKKTSK